MHGSLTVDSLLCDSVAFAEHFLINVYHQFGLHNHCSQRDVSAGRAMRDEYDGGRRTTRIDSESLNTLTPELFR